MVLEENIAKNQHYIPETILSNFVNYEKKLIEVLLLPKKIYETNPRNSMSETFVYEHGYLKRNTVEKYFAKIDSDIGPKIKDIIKDIEELKEGKICIDYIKKAVEELLSTFIIFYYRSGALLTEFSSINKNETIPLLSNKILNRGYIEALSETIRICYKFAIIESNDEFLLSDQFISTASLDVKTQFFDISNRHIGLKGTLLLIPISSKYYIVYWHSDRCFIVEENTINQLKQEDVKNINQTIINNSYVKCVGSKKSIIEDVLGEYEMEYPSQIYAGGNPSGYFCGAIKKKEVFFYKEDREAFKLFNWMVFKPYEKLGRNDICACGSGKKFKRCHLDIYNKVKIIISSFYASKKSLRNSYGIPTAIVYELPIDHWQGFDKNK
ncbi:MAG: hypothetical protein QG603_528 [Patescibacteria group bacterium]|nr:hypothetical protein [Patescibacteria group bacterium]MDQ5970751.1 hypothetical protein [Patescibacteria group bacterium]